MKFTAEAITADWGEKCGDFEPECPTCVTWAMFDEITRLRSIEEAAKRYAGSINGGPPKVNASDDEWRVYDNEKEEAFEGLRAALKAEGESR